MALGHMQALNLMMPVGSAAQSYLCAEQTILRLRASKGTTEKLLKHPPSLGLTASRKNVLCG